MNGFLRQIASVMVIANMVLAPMTVRAQTLNAEDQAKLDLLQSKLDPNAYSIVLDKSGKGAFIYKKGASEPEAFFPFRPQEELRQYSLRNLNEKMKAEMNKIGAVSGAAWSHSLRNLPTESGIFAIAMGAAVATQLFANYSQNPTAMKQHLEHQISPVGIITFNTFMFTQGVTSNVLSMYLKNPIYRHMIPYLGMAVGAFAQSYLSEILSDPNILACSKVLMGNKVTAQELESGIDADPCEKAYEHFVINKKIWEFAPGIISMLASSALAGTTQAIASKIATGAGKVVSKVVTRISGFDIATLLVPGGAQVKGLRLLLVKGLQIYLFVSIDHFLSSKVNFVWKNTWDGAELAGLNDRLVNDTFEQKKTNWDTTDKTLLSNIKQLHKKSSEWRMMNLSDVYEAHQNWSDSLQQLTGMFNASYGFYNAFVNEARNSQKNPRGLLNVSYPLNGVIAKDLAEDKKDLYFTNPAFVQSMQLDTIADVVAYIDKSFLEQTYTNQGWAPFEEKNLKDIRDLLFTDDTIQKDDAMKQADLMKKAQGLIKLNNEINQSYKTRTMTPEYLAELQKIHSMLGEPKPMLEPGRGFGSTYEAAPLTGSTLTGVPLKAVNGLYKTEHLTDYLLMQMVCGPDAEKKESSIQQMSGFPAIFAPPQLKNPNDDFSQPCFMGGELDTPMIYRSKVLTASGKEYVGFLEYLKMNIRPSALGEEKSNFPNWWKQTTESQMQSAFEVYQRKYSEIVATLITRIFHSEAPNTADKTKEQTALNKTLSYVSKFFQVEDSPFNAGPMSNTATISLFQEARTYQMILGEMLKDVYKKQSNSALPPQYFIKDMEPAVQYTSDELKDNLGRIPMIAMLGRTSTLEFSRLVQPFTAYPDVSTISAPTGYRLKVQDDLEKEITGLYDLLKQIKAVTITDTDVPENGGLLSLFKSSRTHTVIQSSIENDQLEEQLLKIQSAIARFKNAIGANEPDQLQNVLSSMEGKTTSTESISDKLKISQQQVQALLSLVSSGPTTQNKGRDVWLKTLEAARGALDAMKNLDAPSKGDAPIFSLSTQVNAAQTAVNGLEQLLNTAKRTSDFGVLWNTQLSAVKTSLQSILQALDNGVTATSSLVKLSEGQKKLALACFENLQALAMEMKMYGSIANAVDWEKLRNLKRLNSEQQAFENETQKKLKQIRAANSGLLNRQ